MNFRILATAAALAGMGLLAADEVAGGQKTIGPARVRDLPAPGASVRDLREAAPELRRWMEERRRLNLWLAAVRREIDELGRLAAETDGEKERRALLRRVSERRSDAEAIIRRLTVLKRRMIGAVSS